MDVLNQNQLYINDHNDQLKYYEDIKGSYDIDKSHLASITNNGVWIKENIGTKTNFIRSKKIEGDTLLDVSIYSFDQNLLTERIEAKSAEIEDLPWIIKDGFKVEPIYKEFKYITFIIIICILE